jgi:aspartate/glutamate racemase
MTNAGDLTWSVEFHADQLVDALDHAILADVSTIDPEAGGRPGWTIGLPTIGIITGNGPDSGMMLWRMINEAVRDGLGRYARGDVSMPRVSVRSLPELGLTMELDQRHRDVWPALRTAIMGLCHDGAALVTLACNTTPHFAPEIRNITREYGAEFVSIAEVAGQWVTANRITEVALVGVKTVAELGPWSPYREPLERVKVEIPDDETMLRIHELAYEVKTRGADHRSLTKLRNVLNRGVKSRVVLLALSEISLVLERQTTSQRSNRVLVDTMKLYAERIADMYRRGLPAPAVDTREPHVEHAASR